ncbi:uncharacterized protein LOC127866665 [Dreissena polymorpha]|uniref:non-specific serine/threonine protein kinase n=1 Tax=Dreissena polymorpha TaxID=45954 RepID=A0A9D4LU96_DREPO|nr:uncharacterized protein LOC127866665 [Dreissena polymorpha]XP_052263352.1 uncharacterized protein LOC127866665 [Dreissena polymorpha]KAH3863904.1 hypothetical protein DPMN_026910 [Dreissena polymorpha]
MINPEGTQPIVGAGGDGNEPTASEVARGLQIVKDNIKDEKVKTDLQDIISKIAHGSVQERSYNILTENLRSFVTNLGSSVHFSLSQTKQIIKTIIVLWNKPFIARHVMKEVYNEDIGTLIDKELLDQIPNDVKQLDDDAIEIFSKALQIGFEEVKNIRLMVVGMFGVGKTSLVNNLIDDFRENTFVPKSTEGIDLHRCHLMQNGDWCLDEEHKLVKIQTRLINAFREAKQTTNKYSISNYTGEQENPGSVFVEEKRFSDDTDIRFTSEARAPIRQIAKEDDALKDFLPLVESVQKTDKETLDNKDVSAKTKTDTTVSVWDFAGQTLYYSTHQFFLNKRSIYLLLMDLTKQLDEYVIESTTEKSGSWCGLVKNCTYLDVFKFWLNAIHMYSGYQSLTGEIQPTVILVGTRKDKLEGSDEEKTIHNDNYFDKALRSFETNAPILKHIHKRKFLVSNLSPGDSIFEELRKEVKRLAEKQTFWGEKTPVRWIQMEQSLDKMRDLDEQLIHYEKINEANKSSLSPLNADELTVCLEIQHRRGNILFFNTDELKHLIILAPQWIIDAFKCFISHVRDKNPTHLTDWDEYLNLGILKPQVCDEIMAKSPEHIRNYRKDVIKYMEHLDVIAKPLKLETLNEVAGNETLDRQVLQGANEVVEQINHKYEDFYIVPCILKNPPPPITTFTSPEDGIKTPVLCFVFCEKFMPPSFFHRLVAVCIRTWPISISGNENNLYNGLAVFDLRPAYTFTIWYRDHIIYARISSCSKKHDLDVDFKLCQEVRHILRKSLLNFVGQSVNSPRTATAFDEYVQCPDMCKSEPNKGMLQVTKFMYFSELDCTACPKRHTVERAEALRHWFKLDLDEADKNDDDLNRLADDDDLKKVASAVGHEFWMLGIELGLKDCEMNQLYDAPECRRDHCTFVYKYLVKWRNKAGDRATLQLLNRAKNAARVYCSKPHTSK